MAKNVTISTYKNKKGEDRIALQMSREFGMRIAIGDPYGIECLDEVRQTIKKRIEAEEAKAEEDA